MIKKLIKSAILSASLIFAHPPLASDYDQNKLSGGGDYKYEGDRMLKRSYKATKEDISKLLDALQSIVYLSSNSPYSFHNNGEHIFFIPGGHIHCTDGFFYFSEKNKNNDVDGIEAALKLYKDATHWYVMLKDGKRETVIETYHTESVLEDIMNINL